MQDWKSHASRRTPHRKLRSSSVKVRKHLGRTFIHAKSLSQREEPGKFLHSLFRNPFFKDSEPETNKRNIWGWTGQTLGLVLLIVMLWFGGGTAYLGWSYFQNPLEEVIVALGVGNEHSRLLWLTLHEYRILYRYNELQGTPWMIFLQPTGCWNLIGGHGCHAHLPPHEVNHGYR